MRLSVDTTGSRGRASGPDDSRRAETPLAISGADLQALMDAADFGVGELLFRAETLQDSGNTGQANADRELARRAHFALARLQERMARNGA